jgi:hypothetical protein
MAEIEAAIIEEQESRRGLGLKCIFREGKFDTFHHRICHFLLPTNGRSEFCNVSDFSKI